VIPETLNYLVASSPRVRRFIWSHFYQTLNRLFADIDWHFLSYGYVKLDSTSPPLKLDEGDEAGRAFVQLYHHVGESAGLAGKEVLDVSSGRGGGTSFMAKYMQPQLIIGVDRSERAVNYSARKHRRPNLAYCAGDAEALPFGDESFDVVVNVEASHCYGSMVGFLREVRRVLRPGGDFVWADVRNARELEELDDAFREAEFRPSRTEDITANVLASLDQTYDLKMKTVQRYVPRALTSLILEFGGMPGSLIYQELARRDKRYLHYACRKA